MNRKNKGFSLLELRMVLAIILVLVALLMPAMRYVSDSARLTSGMSNQRQLAMGHLLYSNDFDKTLCDADDYLSVDWRPPFTAPWPNPDSVPGRSILIVEGYMQPDLEVFRCPADDGERKDRKDITWAHQYIRPGSPFRYTRNAVIDSYAPFPRLLRLPKPALTPLLLEEHELSPMNDAVFFRQCLRLSDAAA